MAAVRERTAEDATGFGLPAYVLAAAGMALTVLYAAATGRLLLFDWFPGPGVAISWIEILGRDRAVSAYLAFHIPAFALYLVALVAVWRWGERMPRTLVFGFPVLFVLALLLMYPPTASDIFHYHAQARTMWLGEQNPLIVPPSHLGYFIGISWADVPSPYGPLWSLLTGFLAPLIVFGDYATATVIGFKVLAAVSYGGCAWLVYRLVARTRPGAEVFAFMLFAWNPFVLMRVVGNAHNDLTMMLFAMVALYFAHRRDWTLSFPLLAMSALIKYTTAALGPAFLVYAWHHTEGSPGERVRALLPGAALAVAVALVAYAPFWAGSDTLYGITEQTERQITSTPEFFTWYLADRYQLENSEGIARTGTALVFLVATLAFTWQARRGFDHLVMASAGILLIYLAVAAGWFRPWYMLWPAVLLALRPTGWGVALFLAITISNTFPDVIEHFRYDWGWTSQTKARLGPLFAQFLLPVTLWIAGALLLRSITLDARDEPPPDAPAPPAGGPFAPAEAAPAEASPESRA